MTEMTTAELARLPVNETIRRYPAAVELFNRHGIDACCGGDASVREAAERDGADAAALIAELVRVVEAT
jgi:regulator of cell morphogenesis and NO signaling